MTGELLRNPFDDDMMKDMPSHKRRCLEERVIDVVKLHRPGQGARGGEEEIAGVRQGKGVNGYMSPTLSQGSGKFWFTKKATRVERSGSTC